MAELVKARYLSGPLAHRSDWHKREGGAYPGRSDREPRQSGYGVRSAACCGGRDMAREAMRELDRFGHRPRVGMEVQPQ